jgi:hypothetical protein
MRTRITSTPRLAAGPRRRARRASLAEHDRAAELGGALAHRAQADAGIGPRAEPSPVVGHLEHGLAAVAAEGDATRARVGVADDVAERLGGDPVDRELGCGRHRNLRLGQVDLDRERREPVGVRADRRGQAEVVQDRRPERVYDASDLGDDVLHLLARAGDQIVGFDPAGVLRGLEREGDPGERGSQAVVQVPPQPAALLLPGGDDLAARLLEPARAPAH